MPRHSLFLDEFHQMETPEQRLDHRRLRMRHTYVGRSFLDFMTNGSGDDLPWAVGEGFCERYDTEVGGMLSIVRQSAEPDGSIEAFKEDYEPRPPVVVDYHDGGRHIGVQEAEKRPEMADVLLRLKQREAEWSIRSNRLFGKRENGR